MQTVVKPFMKASNCFCTELTSRYSTYSSTYSKEGFEECCIHQQAWFLRTFPILVRQGDLVSPGLKIMHSDLTKYIVCYLKALLKGTFDIAFKF